MSLLATVADPLVDDPPDGWTQFVADQRLLAVWHPELLRAVDWCTQHTSSIALVTEASSGQAVAAFHARHLAAGDPRRFAVPGRVPLVSLTEVRSVPALGSGVAFAAGTDERDRREAVRVFERALRARVGGGGRLIAYRGLPPEHLPAMPARGRLRMRLSPLMVVHNQWPDMASYRGSLPRKWRSQLKKIRHTVDTGKMVTCTITDSVEPDEAAWLSELVRRRHLPRAVARPPWPTRYFQALNRLPGVQFVTYRDAAGRLVAYCSVYDSGDEIRPGVWGVRIEADGGVRNLYFDQYLRMVELMVERRRSSLVLGPGMVHIKSRYGATAQPRWGLVGWR